MKAKSYTIKGVKEADFTLPKEFSEKVNPSLIAQTIRVLEARSHTGFSKVKTRAEINRTKKKLYKQKGTGGARHGSRRAPIFVGGGIAHGPKLEKRTFSLPKKVRLAGRNSVLSLKASLGQIVVVAGLEKVVKTKEVTELLIKMREASGPGGLRPGGKYTFLLSEKSAKAKKALGNLKNANAIFFKNANALDVFLGGTLIIDKNIFEKVEKVAKVSKVKTLRTKKLIKK